MTDTRIALNSSDYNAGLKNASDKDLFKSRFREKNLRNLQYLNEKQMETVVHCKKLLKGLGDVKRPDGKKIVVDIYAKVG